ncbi:hypothetical protein FAZ95_25125 [Trinickia violacea]|uniref:Uncharacterized protein n=1 Tax=Trinickia violacea TaxID=2571746 RepID=A0A4P8IYW6_9BURK|nr:hypothetical protein [Trinickia violacea]QCP52454.1 hypothetical protein FAZ95_25125 [Trinickia violacea]
MARIYVSYDSIPELTSLPQATRRAVVRSAASALAGSAEGRSQFRLQVGWLVFVAVSCALFIILNNTVLSGWLSAVAIVVVVVLSYTVVFQFQVRRLRPHIRAVLSAEQKGESS